MTNMTKFADADVLKEIPGYKAIMKAVLKGQIQMLMEQLSEQTGEETVLLTASVSEGGSSHLGSDIGREFIQNKEELKSQFLRFCLKKKQKMDKQVSNISVGARQHSFPGGSHQSKAMSIKKRVSSSPLPHFGSKVKKLAISTTTSEYEMLSTGNGQFSSLASLAESIQMPLDKNQCDPNKDGLVYSNYSVIEQGFGTPSGNGQKVDPGFPGEPGREGEDGLAGTRGFAAIPGLRGIEGYKGYPGLTGDAGVAGRHGGVGMDGESGQPGLPGFPGMPGERGWFRDRPIPGERGEPGRPGFRGLDGYSGSRGEPGLSGRNGAKGQAESKSNTVPDSQTNTPYIHGNTNQLFYEPTTFDPYHNKSTIQTSNERTTLHGDFGISRTDSDNDGSNIQTDNMNIHIGLKPAEQYECKFCYRSFNNRSNRGRHQKICHLNPNRLI